MPKNIIVSTFLIGLFMLIGCDKVNTVNEDKEDVIVGTWQLISEAIGGVSDPLTDCKKEETLEFFEDNTVNNYFVDNERQNDICDYGTTIFDYEIRGEELIFMKDGNDSNGGTFLITNLISRLGENTLEFTYIYDNESGDIPPSEQLTQTYRRVN